MHLVIAMVSFDDAKNEEPPVPPFFGGKRMDNKGRGHMVNTNSHILHTRGS